MSRMIKNMDCTKTLKADAQNRMTVKLCTMIDCQCGDDDCCSKNNKTNGG